MYNSLMKFTRIFSCLAIVLVLTGYSCTKKSVSLEPVIPDPRSAEGDEFIDNADQLSKEAQYQSANHYLEKALEIFQKTKEWEKAIHCYIQRGDNFQQLEDFGAARAELNTALELSRNQLGFKHLELARGFIKIANKYLHNRDFDAAVDLYQKALLIQQEILGRDHPEVARTYNYISRAFFNKGDSHQGNKNYHKSLGIKLRQFQGVNFNVMEKFKLLDRQDAEKSGQPGETGETPSPGQDPTRNGGRNLADARSYLNKSLAVYRDAFEVNDPIFAAIYDNIGILSALEGDYEKALELLRKAFALRIELYGDESAETGESCHHIGVCLRMMKDYKNAQYYLRQALTIKNTYPSENLLADRADILFQLGKIECEFNNPEKALDFYQSALTEIAPGFNDASHHKNPGLDRTASRETLLKILTAKGEALKIRYLRDTSRIKDLRAAYASFQLAVTLADDIRRGFKSESYKIFFVEKSQEIYDEAIQTALMLTNAVGDREFNRDAFILSERGKASVLAETLAESRARRFAGIPALILEKERKYKEELDFYDTLLEKEYRIGSSDPETKNRIKNLETRYYTLKTEYNRFIADFEKQYPRYYELKFDTAPITLPELQHALPSDAAILEYFVGRDFFTVFVVTSQRVEAVSLPILEDFNATVEKFFLSIKKIEVETFLNYSHSLYQNLIAPVKDLLRDKRRLIIIPHSGLYYVPFEALSRKKPSSQKFQDADFLIKHFTISYHYSARLWRQAIMNNNENPARDLSFIGFAPVFADKDDPAPPQSPPLREIVVEGKHFPALPGAEQELQAIMELFTAKNKKARSHLHDDASEMRFKSPATKEFSLIHVATHSITEKNNPKLSGLLFAPSQSKDSAEDGILYSGETYNLDLDAELIVLSSCETGIGKLYRGEGMIGLNRGFLYSGVKNTVFSLWQVEDKTTCRLMTEFYRAILDGKSFPAALRLAKLEMLRDPFTAFPRYWSGFLLVGR